jgi:hypothetical protein
MLETHKCSCARNRKIEWSNSLTTISHIAHQIYKYVAIEGYLQPSKLQRHVALSYILVDFLAECAISLFGVEVGQAGESGALRKRERKEGDHE